MTDPDDAEEVHDPGVVRGTQRGGGRKNVISNSPHKVEYERLLADGWSSLSLERYAAFRYGEDIPGSTFRSYRTRKRITSKVSPRTGPIPVIADTDSVVDILGKRAALVRLQMKRIEDDMAREIQGETLNAQLRQEFVVMNQLLQSMKEDLQDVGLMPKLGEILTVQGPAIPDSSAPKADTLHEALGIQPGEEVAFARTLHLATKHGQAIPVASVDTTRNGSEG